MLKILMIMLFCLPLYAKQIKVAVVDTGVNNTKYNIPLCKGTHYKTVGKDLADRNGHGTNISYLINKEAKGANYCQIIVKIFDEKPEVSSVNIFNALMELYIRRDIDIINLSLSGSGFSELEYSVIKKLLDNGVQIIAAAGNKDIDLDEKCSVYPACYDLRITVVGNGTGQKRQNGSNYGSIVDVWVNGYNKGPVGLEYSGTSQSTAIYTGRVIKRGLTKDK